MARDRDNDNNSRGPRKPPRRGAGRSGAGGPGGGRSGGEGGRFRSERGAKSEGGKRFGEKKSFGERKSFGEKRSFGGKPRGEGRDFKPRERSFNREDRGERRFSRDDRPGGDRPPRRNFESRDGDRPRGERSERPRGERFERPRGERSERPRFNRDRDDRPRGERSERPRGERTERPRFSRDRDGKPPFRGNREDRGERSERPHFNRDRDDKPRFSRDRDGKPPFRRDREERGERAPRDRKFDRPRGERSERPREDRKPRGEWQEHPRSEGRFRDRDERPRRDFGDRPRGEGRSERPRFNRDRDDRPRGERSERPRFSRDRDGERPSFRRERTERRDRDDVREDAPRREPPPASKDGERIAKVVARAGMSSRREAEQWITDGRVAVNGRVITSPALDVVPSDVITIDGEKLPEREPTRLFLHHKPRGLVTTHSDPEGRATVFEQLPGDLPRVISVGRLDYNTEGLLLLTNDGALARALELPANGWLRRYRVRAHGDVTQEQLDALKDGIEVDGVRYGSIDATLDRDAGANVWITFEIREGKNREVRNVLAHLGLDVNRLIRTSYGPFQLGELAEGAVEEVDPSTLYEQLGDKVASVAKLDRNGRSETKPKQRRAGLIADRKGRRVLVERSANASRDDDEDTGQSRPSGPHRRRYHGKNKSDED